MRVNGEPEEQLSKRTKSGRLWVHIALFAATFLTSMLAGVQWLNKDPLELTNVGRGIVYATLMMSFLVAHELGHYTAARRNRVASSLPYFLPFPPWLGVFPFGTLGAVIRLQERTVSKRSMLSIASRGPILGFLVCLILLLVGFRDLPSQEYLLTIHPEYAGLENIPEHGLRFGTNILYELLSATVPPSGSFVPPMNEIYHYPFLCVGWFGILMTSVNLLPVGQLDGGHIAAALLKERHRLRVQIASLSVLAILGIAGILPLVGVQIAIGWPGWLVWAVVLALHSYRSRKGIIREGENPPEEYPSSVGGLFCLLVLFLTFTPQPITL